MRILLLFFVLLFCACKPSADLLQSKKMQGNGYKEECTVVLKNIKPSPYRTYYWYKSNEVHQTKGDYGGDLLQGEYTKHYMTNALAEKGNYYYGLKAGDWKTWYKDGTLKSFSQWQNGELDGRYALYDEKGTLLLKGIYTRGMKTGKWIDYVKQDTTVYKGGSVYVKQKKVKDTTQQSGFFKRLFKKKDSLSIEQLPADKKVKKQKKSKNAKG